MVRTMKSTYKYVVNLLKIGGFKPHLIRVEFIVVNMIYVELEEILNRSVFELSELSEYFPRVIIIFKTLNTSNLFSNFMTKPLTPQLFICRI